MPTREDLPRREELTACIECGCTWDNACPQGCEWVTGDRCSACIALLTASERDALEEDDRVFIAPSGAPLMLARILRVTPSQLILGGGLRVSRKTGRTIGWRPMGWLVRSLVRTQDVIDLLDVAHHALHDQPQGAERLRLLTNLEELEARYPGWEPA